MRVGLGFDAEVRESHLGRQEVQQPVLHLKNSRVPWRTATTPNRRRRLRLLSCSPRRS
jgi:hypothetical protein